MQFKSACIVPPLSSAVSCIRCTQHRSDFVTETLLRALTQPWGQGIPTLGLEFGDSRRSVSSCAAALARDRSFSGTMLSALSLNSLSCAYNKQESDAGACVVNRFGVKE